METKRDGSRGGLLRGFFSLLAVFGLLIFSSAHSLDGEENLHSATELKQLDLEELMHTQVISVSRRPESWMSAPAAIDVLTSEQIRRSGATRLPDLFRQIVGMQVGRVIDDSYAISARGFNGTAANKLQVIQDGRSLYTPLFSGVYWEIQDTLLEDLERVEVVRGPGATLWGANAVNGVINIVSKSAKDTQGWLLLGGAGTEERGLAGIRYGGKIGGQTYFRTYAKYHTRDEQVFPNGSRSDDGMQDARWGFRTDSYLDGENTLTFSGELHGNKYGIKGRPDSESYGGHLLARWTHDFSEDSNLLIQGYYDRGVRDIPRQFYEDRAIYDLDLQHRFLLGSRHEIVWGGNYRYTEDTTGRGNRSVQFFPQDRELHLVSAFLQDEIAIVPEQFYLTLGSKFEHNDYTGFEAQPSLRLRWHPTPGQTLWGAVSRAVRTPSRIDRDLRVIGPLNTVLYRGSEDFRSETLLAYEVGYRVQPNPKLLLDMALFYNQYDHVRSLEPIAPSGLLLVNDLEGDTYGAEAAVRWQVADWWRLGLHYSWLHEKLRLREGSLDTSERNDPRHQAGLVSSFDLPGDVEFDLMLRYVDQLPKPPVPGYLSLDLRLAWFPKPNLELAVVGQNLLDAQHPEFGNPATRAEVQRGVYAKVTWRF